MKAYFNTDYPAYCVFEFIQIRSIGEYVCVCIFCILSAYCVEHISRFPNAWGSWHPSVLKMIKTALSFINMFILMTLNVGFFWSLLMGHGFVHLVHRESFGWNLGSPKEHQL